MMIMVDFWVAVLRDPVEFIWPTVSAQNRPVIDIHLIYPFPRFASAHPVLYLQATHVKNDKTSRQNYQDDFLGYWTDDHTSEGLCWFHLTQNSLQNRSVIDIYLYLPLSTLQFSAPGSVAQSHIMEWAGWAFLWMMITPDDLSASHNMSLTAICSKCSSSMSRVCTCTLVRARIIWNSICGARTTFWSKVQV